MEYKTLIFATVAVFLMVSIDAAPEPSRRRWLARLMERDQLAAAATEDNRTGAVANANAGTGTGVAGAGAGGTYGNYEPFRMERINRGVATILNGVRMGSLEEILRGSFMFTRNTNVRGVADQVISSVFGTPVRNEGSIDAFGNRLNPTDIRVGNNNNNNLNSAVGSSATGSSSAASRG